jgi:hypothetical protein
MQRKHIALLALGLAAIAGLALLWRTSQTATDPSASAEEVDAAASSTAGAAARSGAPAPRPQLPAPATGAVELTELEATGQTTAGTATPDETGDARVGPRVYVRDDGVLVRDHRRRPGPPMASGPVSRPQRTVVKVAPTTVIAVRQAMRPIVYGCSAETPAGSMGAEPRVQGVVVISIAASKLTIDDIEVSTRDLEEPAASQLRDCVTQGVKPLTLTIPDSTDVTGHTLTMPFRLRQ